MEVSKEEKLDQLNRMLQSRALNGSDSLRSFLRFVVEKAAENQDSQLKEYVIATEVFGRNNDYNPQVDSTVRVQAGRLRTKLKEYYATEGVNDKVLIDLPKGHYTPIFVYAQRKEAQPMNGKTMSAAAVAEQSIAHTVSGSVEVANAEVKPAATDISLGGLAHTTRRRIWQVVALVFALLSAVFGFAALNYQTKTIQMTDSLAVGAPGEIGMIDRREVEPLWGDLLSSAEPVLVVYSNTLFLGSAESGMKLLKSLNSPGSSVGSPSIPQSEIGQSKLPVLEHYTGIGEVMGAYFLGDFLARVRHTSRVKRSLLLNWEDLKTENIVVLGSPAENLFLRDLPQQQDFVFKQQMNDDSNKPDFGILNTKPKPGEHQKYFARQDGPSRSQISEDYAVVSLLRGVAGKKRLLILAGITTFGTQAAAEYVTKTEYISDLIAHLNVAAPGSAPKLPMNYQVLVKVKVNGGVPAQISYVSHHVLDQ
ncbi:MAG: hypothetical protein AAB401_00295 [Acidobacteriota bacterium]